MQMFGGFRLVCTAIFCSTDRRHAYHAYHANVRRMGSCIPVMRRLRSSSSILQCKFCFVPDLLEKEIAGSKSSFLLSSEAGTIYTHHQKTVIVDADAGHYKRKIIAFVGLRSAGIPPQQPVAANLTIATASGSSSSSGNGANCSSSSVFASIFASSTPSGVSQPSHSPSSFSDMLCAVAGPEHHQTDLSNNNPPSMELDSRRFPSTTISRRFPSKKVWCRHYGCGS
ncbi:hypothetical protein HYC85_026622 [Camellia sinensis]|uniref:Uncharacterized protein n=1 Tax=Camellia sinensis TaxID=4442 RepID=A0A7J7G431_CAMSI|nr:hypothetical protein HYC85_026622 [Camellia sinensis]